MSEFVVTVADAFVFVAFVGGLTVIVRMARRNR